MPIYLFKHPEKEEYIEIVQNMDDDHKYIDESGLKWERRWTVPQVSVDGLKDIDPFNLNKAADITGKRKGTLGDLWDTASELSARREEIVGHEDPVKREYFDKYEKQNKVKHFHDKKSVIEKNGIKAEIGSQKDLFKGYPDK